MVSVLKSKKEGAKMGLIGKLLFFLLLLLALFFLWSQLAKADAITDIMNMSVQITNSSVFINLSGFYYQIPNSNASYFFQQNFTVAFPINFSNMTIETNLSCINESALQVSCTCPSLECPTSINSSCPSEVTLSNVTKQTLFDQCQQQLQAKIEESSNKVTQDLKFALEPSKVELENCKEAAVNSSQKEQEAYRQRDQQLEANKRLAGLLDDAKLEQKMLMIAALVSVTFNVIVLLLLFSPDILNKFRGTGGGGVW